MEAPKPPGAVPIKKVFIQREYSHGTNICFQNKFPKELEGYISSSIFSNFVTTLNSMYEEAEKLNGRTCCESCFACMTAYLTYLCFDTYFDKCLKRIAAYIQEQNDTVFKPRGLFVVDPIDRGLRVIEIIINDSRNKT